MPLDSTSGPPPGYEAGISPATTDSYTTSAADTRVGCRCIARVHSLFRGRVPKCNVRPCHAPPLVAEPVLCRYEMKWEMPLAEAQTPKRLTEAVTGTAPRVSLPPGSQAPAARCTAGRDDGRVSAHCWGEGGTLQGAGLGEACGGRQARRTCQAMSGGAETMMDSTRPPARRNVRIIIAGEQSLSAGGGSHTIGHCEVFLIGQSGVGPSTLFTLDADRVRTLIIRCPRRRNRPHFQGKRRRDGWLRTDNHPW